MTKPRADQADPTPDLSEAARAVVRDPGDPRTDAFLAALGLGDDPRPAVESADASELEALRARVAELEAALAAAGSRARSLGIALAVAVVAVVVLALVILLNLA